MENQAQESGLSERRWEADAPALAGVSGRMRLTVEDKPLGRARRRRRTLALSERRAAAGRRHCLVRDREDLIKMLRGEVNLVVAALRGIVRQRGDRALGAKVLLGLRAGSPFVHTPFDGKDA